MRCRPARGPPVAGGRRAPARIAHADTYVRRGARAPGRTAAGRGLEGTGVRVAGMAERRGEGGSTSRGGGGGGQGREGGRRTIEYSGGRQQLTEGCLKAISHGL